MTEVLSPSQVGKFGTVREGGVNEGCERQWAFHYLAGLTDAAGPAAAAGTKIHALLEKWLKEGDLPKGESMEAIVARAMLKHCPPPPQARVEEKFEFEIDGVRWRGLKDLTYYADDGPLVVHDHKTTSDLKWAKDETRLRRDAQSIIYAREAFREADQVRISWLYGTRTKKPKVLPVVLSLTFDEVQEALRPITATGKRILKMYEDRPDPNTLDPNLDMCDALGGCPFKKHCHITPHQRIKAAMKQHLRAEEKSMGWKDRLKEQEGSTTEAKQDEVQGQESAQSETTKVRTPMAQKLGYGADVSPPEYVGAVAGAEVVPGTTVSPGKVIDAVFDEVQAPKKRGPGRPKKVQVTATQVFDTPANPDVTAQFRAIDSGFTLCVNAHPTKPDGKSIISLFELLETSGILDEIRKESELEHYKLIDFKSAGVIAACLYTHLQKTPYTGFITCDTSTDEGRDCLPTLERFASSVIRGLR